MEPDGASSEPTPPDARRRAGRRVALGVLALLGVGLAGLLWIVVTGLVAYSRLDAARADLPRLRAALRQGDVAGAQRLAAQVVDRAGAAHSLTSGPAWWAAATIPWLGGPARSSRLLARATDDIGRAALPAVTAVAAVVDRSGGSSSGSGGAADDGPSVDIRALGALTPRLRAASAGVASARQLLATSPPHTWLGVIDDAHTRLGGQLDSLAGQLAGAQLGLRTALPMLGADGPRRYLIAFENEAEARGLGGLPGAFAIVVADRGRLHFTHFGSDTEFTGVRTGLDLGREFAQRYGQDQPADNYPNSDVSPHFPYAARIWAAMWQRVSGQRVDGAIAVDPTALSYLLRVTGPAPLPGGGQVGPDNVVALTQSSEYARFPRKDQKPARKRFVVGVARAIGQRLDSVRGHEIPGLLRAIGRSVGERRLVVWSADPGDERGLVRAGWAGVLPSGADPVTGFAVVNAAGSKLDYYLRRSATYRRAGCRAGSLAEGSLQLTNTAPRRGLPHYVTLRLDDPPRGAALGDNRDIVSYYATRGARIRSVTLDGRPVDYATGTETGLTVVSVEIELPIDQPRTLRVVTVEPAATGAVRVLRQPLVRPLRVSIAGPACG